MRTKLKARVKSKEGLGDGYFVLDLIAPAIAANAAPGQFVMLTVSEQMDPLLPRPFSILDVRGDVISILIKVVGKGTKILYKLLSGMELEITGPLGNTFPDYEHAALVAGGYGIAPFFFLTNRTREGQVLDLFYGGQGRRDILFHNHFEEKLGRSSCHISTEDGTLGFKGIITDLFKIVLEGADHGYEAILTCGPTGMMKVVHELAVSHGVPCYVSMENVMGCGYGVCLGCVVPTSGGMVKTCTEGPILKSDTILWEEM